ncbi:MAG TPA: hypothetical protein VHP11_14835, partial [Tepidisphaeraceae bacterium]|nr:hypothetical protein [Tepidisphaeraceae bacterium]
PIVYLSLGIAQYLWALIGGLFFIATVAIVARSSGLITPTSTGFAGLLAGFVAFTLLGPRYLASPTFPRFLGSTALGIILSPAIMLYQGLAFVLGAFGTRWIPRGSRTDVFSPRQMLCIASMFLPIALLGLTLWYQVADAQHSRHFGLFLQIMLLAMVASPLTAVLVSWPWKRYRIEPATPSARLTEFPGT